MKNVRVYLQKVHCVSYGGRTPAYCSPEQARKDKLTKGTDIWSYGVSILEMFTGKVTWGEGQFANYGLERYLDDGGHCPPCPEMTKPIAHILKKCLTESIKPVKKSDSGNSISRWKSMIAHILKKCLSENIKPVQKSDSGNSIFRWKSMLEIDLPKYCR